MSGPGCGIGNEFRRHPAEFPYFCDGTAFVEKAHWSNWGQPRATASAILNEALLNSHNSVATAPRRRTPSTVVASRLKTCHGHRAYSSIVIRPDRPLHGRARLKIPTLCEFE